MKTVRKGEWFELTVPTKWQGDTIEDLFRKTWNGPKKQIHSLRMAKGVLLNGINQSWSIPLEPGDCLQIKFFEDHEHGVIPAYIDISILYEDDHLLVVNKPAGMDTHPNTPNQNNTLSNAVAFYLQAKGEQRKISHIHRLDRDTTGAILFAKYPFIGAILDRMLEERKIKRSYLALVDGLIKRKQGTINQPIGNDRHHATKKRISPSGQIAITHYKVIETFPNKKQSLVQCNLDTGRTHQIRVHLSSLGHPIVGDLLYGGSPQCSRQALHAYHLEFIHPITDEPIQCHAPFLDQPMIFPEVDRKKLIR
jgi:23S rRNA pseudouridine1911/1915/1917 synthase